MIFTQPETLLESKHPYRPRAEVFILNGNKLIVGQPANGWKGYIIPGGGIDRGEKPADAAQREALEELGVAVKNMKVINRVPKKIDYNSTHINSKSKMNAHIRDLNAKYSGGLFHTFVADFAAYDKSLWGKEIDSYNVKEITIPEATRFFKKHTRDMKRKNDNYNYQKALYVLEILRKLR